MYDIVSWFSEVVAVVLAVVILIFVTQLCMAGPRTSRVHPVANVPNQAAESVLTIEMLSSELQSVTNWYQVGINLDLETHNLDKIQHANEEIDQRRLQMLDLWLRRKLNDIWEDVVSALQQMGENGVAESIRQKYIEGRSKLVLRITPSRVRFTTDSGPLDFRIAYRSLRYNNSNNIAVSIQSNVGQKYF